MRMFFMVLLELLKKITKAYQLENRAKQRGRIMIERYSEQEAFREQPLLARIILKTYK
jgi:hypothetical protein